MEIILEEKKNEKQTIHVGRHVATQVDPPCKFKAKYKYAMPYVRRRDAGGKHVRTCRDDEVVVSVFLVPGRTRLPIGLRLNRLRPTGKVRPDRKGGYWVALHRERNELPFGRDSHLLAVRVAADAKIVDEVRGPKKVRPSEIMERDDGKLYFGSVELPYVGVVKRK